ncbi:DUF350 domain-containing protein [Halosquirtibacter laminarini]|uniref:DUF350 domain-containing protein n=1 Tax=Halosquirtibacter laminarini TaxID=3374600 RepID=A0AC61NPZ3_9BACT|nr:DUF350 domain-containing protein [Prolixibacteraceae bacterium]
MENILYTAGTIILVFLILYIGKALYRLFHPTTKLDHTLVKEDNVAFAYSHIGYLLGILLAVSGTLKGDTYGVISDSVDLLIYGVVSILLINLAGWIQDRWIFHKFSIKDEILRDRNTGAGVLQGASYVSTGLILMGAISGDDSLPFLSGFMDMSTEGNSAWWALGNTLLFWIIGQIILLFMVKVYDLITPYDIHHQIEQDNVAVGIGTAGAFVAIAILISNGISGEFVSWSDTAFNILSEVVIGVILLPLSRLVCDKLLLPGENLTHEMVEQKTANIGAGAIEAFAYIASALVIVWLL